MRQQDIYYHAFNSLSTLFLFFYFCCHLFRCDSNKNYIIFVVVCQLLFWTTIELLFISLILFTIQITSRFCDSKNYFIIKSSICQYLFLSFLWAIFLSFSLLYLFYIFLFYKHTYITFKQSHLSKSHYSFFYHDSIWSKRIFLI